MGMLEDAIRDYTRFAERSDDPSTPDTGEGLVYFKDGKLHTIDDAGTVVEYGTGGGGGGGAGSLVQVVTATSTVEDSTQSLTLVNTSLSVTITPQHDDSILLVEAYGFGDVYNVSGSHSARRSGWSIRNTTDGVALPGADTILYGRSLVSANSDTARVDFGVAMKGTYTVDSTAARTFRLQYRVISHSGLEARLRGDNSPALMVATEVRP